MSEASLDTPLRNAPAGRCYGCFRPLPHDCFCRLIPQLANRTHVLILQHVRERFHPFNTARIVRKALTNSRLIVTVPQDLERDAGPHLRPRAGLLFPGSDSALLTEVPVQQFPEQLVVLDGTWHQAKTLVRDNGVLRQLPQYRLAPAAPSQYRIRREPTEQSLSTVEATIAALRTLEPATSGFEELLAAFQTMVDRQLARPKTAKAGRVFRRRRSTSTNIPTALLGPLDDVVACYGESPPGSSSSCSARPVYWVAQRLGSGERFARLVRPEFELTDSLLGHLQLSRQDFEQAVSLAEARAAWQAFVRPSDLLAVFNQGVARLLDPLGMPDRHCLVLKSVQLGLVEPGVGQTLDELLASASVVPQPPGEPGRAGQRLANLVAWIRELHARGQVG